jgi:CheY-like chemotaxis protein
MSRRNRGLWIATTVVALIYLAASTYLVGRLVEARQLIGNAGSWTEVQLHQEYDRLPVADPRAEADRDVLVQIATELIVYLPALFVLGLGFIALAVIQARRASNLYGEAREAKAAAAAQQLLEEPQVDAQKAETIGRLASSFAHDFNNVLGSIQGYAEIIADTAGPEAPTHRFASQILTGVRRGQNLVDRITETARPRHDNGAETCDVATTVDDVEGPRPEAPPKPQAAPQALRILLVDDDEFLSEAAGEALTRAGHHVEFARDGETALAALGNQPGDIDVVLTDDMMPGMRGPELIRRLRQQGNLVPIVLWSANADRQALDEAGLAANVEVCGKPVSTEELLATLQRATSFARDKASDPPARLSDPDSAS